jgi:hypothetical protein
VFLERAEGRRPRTPLIIMAPGKNVFALAVANS